MFTILTLPNRIVDIFVKYLQVDRPATANNTDGSYSKELFLNRSSFPLPQVGGGRWARREVNAFKNHH